MKEDHDTQGNHFADSSFADLQQLLLLWSERSPDVKRLILERGIDRMRAIAFKMLHESFPRLANEHELDSIINETWMRLAQALEKSNPPTVTDYFRLVAHKIRHVLLDMARKHRAQAIPLNLAQDTSQAANADPSNQTYDPVQLTAWSEFHERVAKLEDDQRQVFEMHYYLELPQSQIAELLGMPAKKISRLWIKATDTLTKGLDWSGGLQ